MRVPWNYFWKKTPLCTRFQKQAFSLGRSGSLVAVVKLVQRGGPEALTNEQIRERLVEAAAAFVTQEDGNLFAIQDDNKTVHVEVFSVAGELDLCVCVCV